MSKVVNPSTQLKAFSCPHCHALTSQYWHQVYLKSYTSDSGHPRFPTESEKEEWIKDSTIPEEERSLVVEYIEKTLTKLPFLDTVNESPYTRSILHNLNISQCYHCDQFSIWVHNKLIFPEHTLSIQPNSDLSDKVKSLFVEALQIVDQSPKGSAALLRLALQHLCKDLGESGKDINGDIGSLVKKGLNPIVQKSLDIVRVVGNEAVHPGTIDLDDNREISLKLFELISLIADQMITHPNQVAKIYESLPEGKRKGIDNRDGNN